MEKITKEEAIKRGFTYCGYSSQEYQSLMSINDLDIDNFESGTINPTDKEPITVKIKASKLMSLVIDNYCESDEIYDDTGDIDDIIEKAAPMFDEFANRINELYAKKPFYALIPDIEIIY